jgi:hypothetical protein
MNWKECGHFNILTKWILYRSYREEWHRNGKFYHDCHNITDTDTYNYVITGNVKLLPKDASPKCDGHRRRVASFNTSTNVEYGTGTQKCKKWDVHGISHETRGTYNTVLYADRIPDRTKSKYMNGSNQTKKVKIAIDGGAIPFKGSLGFVFADEDGTILLTCFGQPSVHDPLSFRSEISYIDNTVLQ